MADLVPSSSVAPMGSGAMSETLPSKITITRAPGVFELSWKWREQVSRRAFFAPFALLPLPALNFWRVAPSGTLVVLGALAGAFAMLALAYAKNTVRLRITQGALELTSHPIGLRKRAIVDIVRIDAESAPHHKERPRFGVRALTFGGQNPWLIRPMLEESQARAIAELLSAEIAESSRQLLLGDLATKARRSER